MAIPNADSTNERFLAQVDFLGWIFCFGGSVAVNVNEDVRSYFQTKKGLRQGEPLSPILFNIVVDMLLVLINKVKADGQISGIVPHLVDDGLSILQYVMIRFFLWTMTWIKHVTWNYCFVPSSNFRGLK
jgi:hypothetical protein